MLKILALCWLLAMSSSLTYADIYRCIDASGTILFADDPSRLPAGCKPDKLEESPPPAAPQSEQAPVDALPYLAKPAEVISSAAPEADQEDDGSLLRAKADKLLEQFTVTRRQIVYSSYAKDKLKARNDLQDIRLQKNQLLTEVEQSRLSESEKDEIRTILSPITETE